MASETLPKRRLVIIEKEEKTRPTREDTRKEKSTYINNTRGNIKINITYLYGEETLQQTKKLEKFKIKRSRQLCNLTFLERCRDNNIIPKSLKITFQKKNQKTDNILRRASLALLREAIHDTRRDLDHTNIQLLKWHLVLSNKIHPILWTTLDQLMEFRCETEANLTKNKHIKKFEKLLEEQKPNKKNHHLDPKKVVHNLSTVQLDEATQSVLAKGFNYAVAPIHIPVEEIICGVESSIIKLEKNKAEEIRQDISRILRTARPPKKNLSTEEYQALRSLKQNPDITILPADKGNATVLMNKEDYDNKIQALLADPAYEQISSDPTTYLEKTTRMKIKASQIDKDIQGQLIPREKSSRCPKFYGLPKIHKEGTPLRPIVSCIGSPLQQLAKFLAKQLQPYAEEMESNVKNADHFIELLKKEVVQPGDLLVSFDVVSLFTNIPVEETLDIIKKKHKPAEHILELTRHCIKNTYFIYKEQRYKQVAGAPMGSPLSPVLANLFMEDFETRSLQSANQKPKLWLRYVDDTFVIWNHGREQLNLFLDHLNGIHPNIKFTMEVEEQGQLPFLDVLVRKRIDGSLSHTVYRKTTHTNRYLNANSHHHPAQLQSVVKTLITRSQRLTDNENKQKEMKTIETALLQNGYSQRNIKLALRPRKPTKEQEEEEKLPTKAYLPYVKGTTDKISRVLKKNDIKTIFTTDKKISNILPNPKTKINLESHGVYEVPCQDCDKTYIGQTNRRINVRRDEHQNSVRKNEGTSSLAQHVKATSHTIDFENTKMIANIEHQTRRIIREAIEIEKRPNNLNTRDDTQRLPHSWKPALHKLAQKGGKRKSSTTPATAPMTQKDSPNQSGPATGNKSAKRSTTTTGSVYKPAPPPENFSSRPNTRSRTRNQSKT